MAQTKIQRKKISAKKAIENAREATASDQRLQQQSPGRKELSIPARPGGKLGQIIERLATSEGATVDELAAATGWQKHTVHGALSRLRARGFPMRLETRGDRKAYRIEHREG